MTTYSSSLSSLYSSSLSNIVGLSRVIPVSNTKSNPISIEDISKILYFKTHNTDGTPKTYETDYIICYRDRLFIAISNTTREPYPTSEEWTELMDVTSRFDISEIVPSGLKRPGDRWYNPITSLIYEYTKSNDTYIWLSN